MQRKKLIEKLLETKLKREHFSLLKQHENFLDPDFAGALKNTYYDSWTKEPQKTRNAATALEVLADLKNEEEYRALAVWVKGIADLTEGKLEKAVADLDQAAAIFKKIEREHDAAQTQVAKLIALAMLGNYEEAIATGVTALKIFEKHKDELAAGKIEKNLGNIVARQGDEKRAEKYYLSARKRFVKLGNVSELTMSDNSLANTYAELNDFKKAEDFYARALENARRAKMKVTEAEIEASMGNLALFRGRYADALRFLEFSRQKYEILGMPHQTAIAELEIADIYSELNLSKEASEIYQKVTKKLRKLKMRGEEARARGNFGKASADLKKTNLARRELEKSARLYELEKNPIGAATVKISQANFEISLGRYEKASMIIEQAATLLENFENVRLKLTLKLLKAEILRNFKKFDESEKLFTEVFAKAVRQEQANLAQISLNSLGKLALDKKDLRRAKEYFKKAVKLIENLRAPLAAEEFRMAFLSDKLAPFENLAKIHLAENKLKDAFLIIEKARARVLAETLGGGGLSNENQTENSSDLTKKSHALREELNWFYSRLNRGDESEIASLQAEVRKRERQMAQLLRQIESTKTAAESNTGAKKSISGLNFENLQNNLGARTALVEFVCFDGVFSVFVITDEKIFFEPALAKEDEIISLLENLRFQFGALRYGTKNLDKFTGELKKRADFYLQKLYEKIFEPIEKRVEKRDLIVVPAASLNYVPFQALRGGEKYLIEKRKIAYAPSATVWNFLREKSRREMKNALLIGFADERIPLVDREIEALQKIFSETKALSGADATFSAFTQNAGKFDILHIACHGQFRPENPMFSSLHLADGFVTVRDVCSQKLNANLVCLSACETGLNEIFAGDEILGLARGFLSAGANSLILSLWTVSDESTTRLMKIFYKNLQQKRSVSASLAQAQREFIKENAHPFYWSPFVLIGR